MYQSFAETLKQHYVEMKSQFMRFGAPPCVQHVKGANDK